MTRIQKFALAVLVLALLAGILATWGSLGSIVLCFGLVTTVAALLYRRFLDREDSDDYGYFQ